MYAVGDLGLAAQQARGATKRGRKAAAEGADIAAAAPALDEPQQARRRRRAKDTMIGRGYEYMDLEPTPSDVGAGRLGFAGSAARESGAEPTGLATLTRDQFGGDTTVPMLPGTWNPELD